MAKISVKYTFIILFLILLSGIFVIILSGKAPKNLFCALDIGTHRIPLEMIDLFGQDTIGQTFKPNFDNLFKISVFISTKGATPDARVVFHLRRADKREDIFRKELTVSELRPQRNNFYLIGPDPVAAEGFHYHIQFSPVTGIKDKKLYFYFELLDKKASGPVRLGIWRSNYYESLREGELMINHAPQKGSFLAFRTYNTWNKDIKDVIRQIKARLLIDKAFFVFYAALLLLIIACLIVNVIAVKRLNR